MRIWHEKLIHILCRQHLLAVWREGLGCYKIITENKKGYHNHPATQEFINSPADLWNRLSMIRIEMLARGWNPKPLSPLVDKRGEVKEWQDLDTQVKLLRSKGCECKVTTLC